MGLEKLGTHSQNMTWYLNLTSSTKINSVLIITLNKHKTTNPLKTHTKETMTTKIDKSTIHKMKTGKLDFS